MVKRAVISDIHGNLEALDAVLADAQAQGAEKFFCLGDVVGYGPNPRECVDRILHFDLCILGNHDQGALYDPEGFSSGAERAIFWTREQLENPNGDPQAAARRWEFLSQLPRTKRLESFLFVHGSARNPLNEYVFPEDVYNPRKLERLFSLIERICFQGHTHVPGVFTEDGRFISPAELKYHFVFPATGKAMVNVGSVGQPRDGDKRSCYVMLEDDKLEFRRVEYDVDQTAKKITDIPELDNFFAERLKRGQ